MPSSGPDLPFLRWISNGKLRKLSVAKGMLVGIIAAGSASFAGAAEGDRAPRSLPVPVLGLTVPVAALDLETLPDEVRKTCPDLADDATWTGHLWVFAKANYGGVTYYLLSGYLQRNTPQIGKAGYVVSETGNLQVVSDGECSARSAREVFELRDFEATPQPVLRALAGDLLHNLARVFGTVEPLRTEMSIQRVDVGHFPPEVREMLETRLAASER